MLWLQAAIVTGFLLVHLFAGKLRLLDVIPRSRWLSLAGGISVAYVFIHVFPELEKAQRAIGESWQAAEWIEHHAYLVALSGLAVFYGWRGWSRPPEHDSGSRPEERRQRPRWARGCSGCIWPPSPSITL